MFTTRGNIFQFSEIYTENNSEIFCLGPPGLPKQPFQEAVSQKFSQNHRHGALFHICLTFFTKLVQGFLITCKWLSKHSAPSERLYVKMSQNKQKCQQMSYMSEMWPTVKKSPGELKYKLMSEICCLKCKEMINDTQSK